MGLLLLPYHNLSAINLEPSRTLAAGVRSPSSWRQADSFWLKMPRLMLKSFLVQHWPFVQAMAANPIVVKLLDGGSRAQSVYLRPGGLTACGTV